LAPSAGGGESRVLLFFVISLACGTWDQSLLLSGRKLEINTHRGARSGVLFDDRSFLGSLLFLLFGGLARRWLRVCVIARVGVEFS
jgi:hypothetical protein